MARSTIFAILYVLVLACALFVPAGGAWTAAWVFLAVVTVFVIAAFVLVPDEVIHARSRAGEGVHRSDVWLASTAAVFLYAGTLVIAGIDVGRAHWSPPLPFALEAAGIAIFVAGYSFSLWAMRENPFFETFMRIQHERGHHVVATGPYAIVRHPGYAGTIVAHLAIPLALGSWIAFAPALIGAALFAVRTAREDRALTRDLPGYDEYREEVHWRLFPGLW